MEKYGVQQQQEKVAAVGVKTNTCPDCGSQVEQKGSVLWCPNCGTKPYEGGLNGKKESGDSSD